MSRSMDVPNIQMQVNVVEVLEADIAASALLVH